MTNNERDDRGRVEKVSDALDEQAERERLAGEGIGASGTAPDEDTGGQVGTTVREP